MHIKNLTRILASATVALAIGSTGVKAEDVKDPYRDSAMEILQGKTIAYLPISIGFDLARPGVV
jgi:ribose transport system substrate-binding protein